MRRVMSSVNRMFDLFGDMGDSSSNWILITGVWRDNGFWEDDAVWID